MIENPQFEPLAENSPWKMVDAKLPILGIPFDPDNPATYHRIIFNEQTGQHTVLENYELEKLKARLKNDPRFRPTRAIDL